jgi:tRNA threonylcarbamoyladenosine biosynthesis protein TsaB
MPYSPGLPLARRERFVGRRMTSLRDLLDLHGTLLLLDAASVRVQVGWLERGREPRWRQAEADALQGLFRGLVALEAAPSAAGAFVFCEGPGSILGIRTCAMTIETWRVRRPRPTFAYRSLELFALTRCEPGDTAIADARRDSWHAVTRRNPESCEPLSRLANAALPARLLMPTEFRHWTRLPEGLKLAPYDLSAMWRQAESLPLLRPVERCEAYGTEATDYVTWTPRVHQAPGP